MTFGLIVSFVINFSLLPILIIIFNPEVSEAKKEQPSRFINICANISIHFPKSIYFLTLLLVIFSVYGISKLKVENSFINYFSSDTEIYKGMKNIDQKLGGTTPLEIILKFKDTSVGNNNDDFLGSNSSDEKDYLGEVDEKIYSDKYK